MVDCDVYESENWLGTGKCKYSWECRGARVCEGQGWCYGDDACEEVHERVTIIGVKNRQLSSLSLCENRSMCL